MPKYICLILAIVAALAITAIGGHATAHDPVLGLDYMIQTCTN